MDPDLEDLFTTENQIYDPNSCWTAEHYKKWIETYEPNSNDVFEAHHEKAVVKESQPISTDVKKEDSEVVKETHTILFRKEAKLPKKCNT